MTKSEWMSARLRQVRTGILGYIIFFPVLLLTFLAVSTVLDVLSVEAPQQTIVQIFLKEPMNPYLVSLMVVVVLLAPVLEEIFFRGFAYAGLRKRFGFWGGASIISVVFAAVHFNGAAFVPIFFLGMFLTYLYESSGSLIPSIVAHMLHNSIMLALTLSFKSLLT